MFLFIFVDEEEDKGCAAAIWENDFEYFKIKRPGVIDLKLLFRTYVSKVYFKNTWDEKYNQNPSKRFFKRIGKLPKFFKAMNNLKSSNNDLKFF